MKVIFTQDVRGRGQRGQIKEVPDGYAQNYLIKRGLAKQATKAAMSQLKGQQRAEEKHAAEELADAKRMKKKNLCSSLLFSFTCKSFAGCV